MGCRRRLSVILAALVSILLNSIPKPGRAEVGIANPPPAAVPVTYTQIRHDVGVTRSPSAASSPSSPVAHIITAPALDAMADLFSATPDEVSERLRIDPGLVDIGIEAAQQSKKRGRTGKAMTTIGWTIVGLGLTVAFGMSIQAGFDGMALWGDCDIKCQDARANGESRAFAVGLASLVAGIAIAIPGMLMLRHASEREKQAILRYHQKDANRPTLSTQSPSSAASLPSQGKNVALPMLRLSF
jgi:hypothetical protein